LKDLGRLFKLSYTIFMSAYPGLVLVVILRVVDFGVLTRRGGFLEVLLDDLLVALFPAYVNFEGLGPEVQPVLAALREDLSQRGNGLEPAIGLSGRGRSRVAAQGLRLHLKVVTSRRGLELVPWLDFVLMGILYSW
jgi:hypothetical protein